MQTLLTQHTYVVRWLRWKSPLGAVWDSGRDRAVLITVGHITIITNAASTRIEDTRQQLILTFLPTRTAAGGIYT